MLQNNTAILSDTSGNVLHKYVGHNGHINSIDISMNGKYILTEADDKTVRLWTKGGKLLKVIETPDTIYGASFLNEELNFQLNGPGYVKLYDINGTLIQQLSHIDSWVIKYPGDRFLYYIKDDGIHRILKKDPVDSVILKNNHNDLNINDKIEHKILSYKDLEKSVEPNELYLAGKYIMGKINKKNTVNEKKNDITIVEKLLNKALKFDTLQVQTALALTDLFFLKDQYFKIDLRQEIEKCHKFIIQSNDRDDLINAFNFYSDYSPFWSPTIQDSTKISCGYPEKAISICLKLIRLFRGEIALRHYLEQSTINLVDGLLVYKQYKTALSAVKASILAQNTNETVFTYANEILPVVYILNGMYSEAEKEYLKWKDKPMSGGKTYRSMFLDDIKYYEKRDIAHPDFAKVKELLKK